MTAGLPVILCDVDEVCADLHEEWIRRYNVQYDDTLDPKSITDWGLVQFVKPECGKKVFDILREPDLYDNIKPIAGSVLGIKVLRKFARVVFVSSCVVGTTDSKIRWLIRNKFLRDDRSPVDFIAAKDKALVRGNILIDDAPHNVEAYPGQTILFDQAHNRHIEHPNRALNWDDVVVKALRMVA